MIRVNLLPPHLRPVRRSSLPYLITFLIAALLFLYIVFSYTSARIAIARAETKRDALKAQLASKQHIIDEVDRLNSEKKALANKIKVIQNITKNRIIWSRQLWNLCRLRPSNFWYKDISVVTEVHTEQRLVPVKQKRSKKTKKVMKKVQVTKEYLIIEGYVIEDDKGNNDVNPLLEATTKDPEFSSLFKAEPAMWKADTFGDTPVQFFRFRYEIGKWNTGNKDTANSGGTMQGKIATEKQVPSKEVPK